MSQLNFNLGLVTYTINGACEVTFNPTDINFIERLYTKFEELDKKQSEFEREKTKITEPLAMFEFARKRDTEMRAIIDSIFGVPVSDAIFGTLNVYAYADGFPLWANFLTMIVDAMDTGLANEKKASSPRMEKYLKKYSK